MIPVTADDQAVSEDVVRKHHEAQDGDNEELEVAGQKGYHKTSHWDVKDIKHPSFELFWKLDKFFSWNIFLRDFLFQDCDFTLYIFPTADKVVVDERVIIADGDDSEVEENEEVLEELTVPVLKERLRAKGNNRLLGREE